MPTSRALRLCPDAIVIPPDFPAYKDASRRVWEIVHDNVETVQRVGLDEGYLDVSDHPAPKASLRRLVSEIRAATGLNASIGIGPNKLVAKMASDAEKPKGFLALSREMACERFAPSPPGADPGHRPQDGRTPPGPRHHHDRGAAEHHRGRPQGAATPCPLPRVDQPRDPPHHGLRVVRADVRRRHRRPGDARGQARRAGDEPVRAPAAQRPPRPDDRHQGPARRLDDGDARTHDHRRHQRGAGGRRHGARAPAGIRPREARAPARRPCRLPRGPRGPRGGGQLTLL